MLMTINKRSHRLFGIVKHNNLNKFLYDFKGRLDR